MTTTFEPDYVAARIHRRNAERHYTAAERARKHGLVEGEAAALRCGRQEDHIADLLEGIEPRGEVSCS